MNKKGQLQVLLLLSLTMDLVGNVAAETVVDVSHQWQDHVSSSPISVPSSPVAGKGPVPVPEKNSCECESLSTPEMLEACTYAFTGRVIGLRAPKKGRRIIALDVDEVFKGTPKAEMEVEEEVSGTDCALPIKEGENYLVYGRWEWGHVLTSRCMGTKRLEKTGTQALGPSQSLKEKLYIHLRNACMGRMDTSCCLSSLKAMRDGYNVPEPEGGCPSGAVPDRLSCSGSYTWCIPLTEKNHQSPPHK